MVNNKSELKVIVTDDHSATLYHPTLGESFHSTFGALQESRHVFIKNGFDLLNQSHVAILEVGFGTGLNCALTMHEAIKKKINVTYLAFDPYEIPKELILEFSNYYDAPISNYLVALNAIGWEQKNQISPYFSLSKQKAVFQTFMFEKKSFDLIYYDAFSPDKQNDMWTLDAFKILQRCLKSEGILTTYCAKGQIKRDMREAGFTVKSVPGPKGKREMIVALNSD